MAERSAEIRSWLADGSTAHGDSRHDVRNPVRAPSRASAFQLGGMPNASTTCAATAAGRDVTSCGWRRRSPAHVATAHRSRKVSVRAAASNGIPEAVRSAMRAARGILSRAADCEGVRSAPPRPAGPVPEAPPAPVPAPPSILPEGCPPPPGRVAATCSSMRRA